jgi:hypothetical protein
MIQKGIHRLIAVIAGFRFFLMAPGMETVYKLMLVRIQRVVELAKEMYVSLSFMQRALP